MDRIGKYEVLDRIGSGGFATVFKGYDPFIKRPVAIKVCNTRDQEARQRFFREAEIAGSLEHRNITTVFDFGMHEETPYLVEEYLPGEDLAHQLRRQEPRDLPTRLDFLIQIASGLEYAHRQGVIHRDIKPSNIRVLESGRCKIMDFGTAKLADVESHLTQAGMTLGTVAYLSPERLLGRETRINADIFSYGVLAYELLTFRRPFSGRNIPHLIDQVLNAAPTPVLDSWPECPPRLAQIVERCLLKDPDERYATCTEVLVDLQQVMLEAGINLQQGSFAEPSSTLTLPQPNLQISGLLERARQLHGRNKLDRALMMLEEVLEMAPDNLEAQQLMAVCKAELEAADGAPETDSAAMTSTRSQLLSWEGPDERRARKRGEAVASIEKYIEAGELLAALEAIKFASQLFGPIEDAPGLARRTVTQARRQVSDVKGEALQAARRIVDHMIDLRRRNRLSLPLAETLSRHARELDPDNLAAHDILGMVREETERAEAERQAQVTPPPVPTTGVPTTGAPRPAPTAEQDAKRLEAVASIEELLAKGDAPMAAQALEFAIRLYGELEQTDQLRRRIDAAMPKT